MSGYAVWVVESRSKTDTDGPWEIEAVDYGIDAQGYAERRVATENGNDSAAFFHKHWRCRRYVPQ